MHPAAGVAPKPRAHPPMLARGLEGERDLQIVVVCAGSDPRLRGDVP